MRKLLLVFSLLVVCQSRSQNRVFDSLKLIIRQARPDTGKVKELNELAWQYIDFSTDSAKRYVGEALSLAQRLHYSDGIIDAKNSLGILCRYAGERDAAIRLYQEIIRLRIQQKRFDKLTGAYANLGSVYFDSGDQANALRYYLKAFKNAQVLKQTDPQMMLLNNLGNAYKASGLFDLAIASYQEGLALNKKVGSESQEALLYANLAMVYDDQNLYAEALRYSKMAYGILKRIQNIRSLSSVVNNLTLYSRHMNDYKATENYLAEMKVLADELKEVDYYAMYYQSKANFYNETGRFKEALTAADAAIRLGDSLMDPQISGTSYLIKASVLYSLKNFQQSLLYFDKGINIVKDNEDKSHLMKAYVGKSDVLSQLGDYKAALQLYQRSSSMQDSLKLVDYTTKIATLNALNELDKKERELQLSIKGRESVEAKNKQQAFFLMAAIVITVLVIILLAISVRGYQAKKKDNVILNAQKQEILIKNETLRMQTMEIQRQMITIEEKQKEILDSIHYAKRIQHALLSNKEIIRRHFADLFILFKPKDIVSGDFYWAAEKDSRLYFAVCDSTGHGVPGAFMSLLNINFLNEAVNEKNIVAPNDVLNHVREKLIASVSQDGAKDGMDTILIAYDQNKGELSYAAANNKPLLLSEEGLEEFPADKMPVGLGEKQEPFTLRTINVNPGQILYLYSDGYADQFGGPKGKKFKYKALNQFLQAHGHLSMEEQQEVLDQCFESWRGGLEQVDDVLLVGLKF